MTILLWYSIREVRTKLLFSKNRSGKYVSKVVTRDNSVVLSVGTLSEYSEDRLFTIGDAVVEAIIESTNCSDLEADTVQVRIERKKITVVFDLRARFVGNVASSGNFKVLWEWWIKYC